MKATYQSYTRSYPGGQEGRYDLYRYLAEGPGILCRDTSCLLFYKNLRPLAATGIIILPSDKIGRYLKSKL